MPLQPTTQTLQYLCEKIHEYIQQHEYHLIDEKHDVSMSTETYNRWYYDGIIVLKERLIETCDVFNYLSLRNELWTTVVLFNQWVKYRKILDYADQILEKLSKKMIEINSNQKLTNPIDNKIIS